MEKSNLRASKATLDLHFLLKFYKCPLPTNYTCDGRIADSRSNNNLFCPELILRGNTLKLDSELDTNNLSFCNYTKYIVWSKKCMIESIA